jgi:hypothetical protein
MEMEKGISTIDINKEMREAYLQYSMSVIVGRALPDVRDGLKPVHSRILFAQHEMSNTHDKPYKKSARVVGDVIGKYHPHGDTLFMILSFVWLKSFLCATRLKMVKETLVLSMAILRGDEVYRNSYDSSCRRVTRRY